MNSGADGKKFISEVNTSTPVPRSLIEANHHPTQQPLSLQQDLKVQCVCGRIVEVNSDVMKASSSEFIAGFYQLPSEIITYTLSEFLDARDLGRLDSATTSATLRPRLHEALGARPMKCFGYIRSKSALNFLVNKRIQLQKFEGAYNINYGQLQRLQLQGLEAITVSALKIPFLRYLITTASQSQTTIDVSTNKCHYKFLSISSELGLKYKTFHQICTKSPFWTSKTELEE